MVNFFKSFGKGILYVLVLPVLLVILALYAAFALIGFIYLTIKGLILFFTGRSLFDDLPEDKKAKAIIKANTINPDDYTPEGDMPYVEEKTPVQNETVSREIYTETKPASEDPFYVPEYLKPEEDRPVMEEAVEEEEDLVTPEDIAFEKVEREEIQPEEEIKIEPENKEEKEDIPYMQSNYQADEIEIGNDDDDDDWDGDSSNLRL